MNNEDLEYLRSFVDRALHKGWAPSSQPAQGTYVVYDPPCIRISIASPSRLVDNDIYVDWLGPLHENSLAKAVWGESLIANTKQAQGVTFAQPAWRHHQHQLLDLLQTAGPKAYFEYLGLTQ